MGAFIMLMPLIALPSLLVGYRARSINLFILTIVCVCFTLFAVFRGDSANDYRAYIEIFDAVPSFGEFSFDAIAGIHGERGFLLYISLLKSLGFSSFDYIAFMSVIAMYFKARAYIKISNFSAIAMTVYLAQGFFVLEFIQARWALAMSICFFAVINVHTWGPLKAGLVILLTATVSSLTIVFLPLIFLKTPHMVRSFWWACLVMSGFVLGKSIDLVSIILGSGLLAESGYTAGKVSGYVSNNSFGLGTFFLAKTFLFAMFCFWLNTRYALGLSAKITIRVILYTVFLVFLTSSFAIISGRLFMFLDMVSASLIAIQLSQLNIALNRAIIGVLVLIYVVALWWFNINIAFNSGIIWGYGIGW